MRDRGVSKADVALVIHSPESWYVRIDGRTEAKRPTRQGDYVKVVYIEESKPGSYKSNNGLRCESEEEVKEETKKENEKVRCL